MRRLKLRQMAIQSVRQLPSLQNKVKFYPKKTYFVVIG